MSTGEASYPNASTDAAGAGNRHVVCGVGDLPSGQMRAFELDGVEVLLIHGPHDRFYAISNECSHGEAPLDMGTLHVDQREVECGVHAGRFDFATGQPTQTPCVDAIPVYSVGIDGDRVVVTL